jgi:hypothetical protein
MLIIDIDDIFVAPSPSLYFVKKDVRNDVVGRHLLTTFRYLHHNCSIAGF